MESPDKDTLDKNEIEFIKTMPEEYIGSKIAEKIVNNKSVLGLLTEKSDQFINCFLEEIGKWEKNGFVDEETISNIKGISEK